MANAAGIFAERDTKWQKKLDAQADRARKLRAQLRVMRGGKRQENPFNRYALEMVKQDIQRLREEKTELLTQLQRREDRENYSRELAASITHGLTSDGARAYRGGQLYR